MTRQATVGKHRKIFAVGDIHGCFEKLARLIGQLPIDPAEDRIIFIGDYINRGPQSREVIDFLLDLQTKMPRSVFLMGNHEHALLRYAAEGDLEYLKMLRSMGVEATLQSYPGASVDSLRDLSFLPAPHRAFLETLLPFHEENGYLFTHAGIVPGEDHRACPLDRLLSVRSIFLEDDTPLDSVVVFGHTPFLTPLVTSRKIGIDTGAVLGNMLTAVELPRLRFYHV